MAAHCVSVRRNLVIVLLLCCSAYLIQGRPISSPLSSLSGLSRKLLKLVEEEPLILTYHNGPILNGATLPVYIVWYGNFSDSQKSIVQDFFSSFQASGLTNPSVSSWWKPALSYKDGSGSSIAAQVSLQGQVSDFVYSKGKALSNSNIQELVISSLPAFSVNTNAMYLVLTAEDVEVEDFCTNSCASHFATNAVAATNNQQLPYAWVGNSAQQCPGKCAWPFATPEYGPKSVPLLAPNGDLGIDGLIVNIGTVLAGTATNPFNNGFYQGDGAAPLEAGSACSGAFGEGAYQGYPGQVSSDQITGVSFNVYGVNERRFLLPAVWDPATLKCTTPS